MQNHQIPATYRDRTLIRAKVKIRHTVSSLRLPQYVEKEATYYYRKLSEAGLIKGRKFNPLMAGILYYTCRVGSLPYRMEEISSAVKSDYKGAYRMYKFVSRNLKRPSNPPDKNMFIPKFSASLGLDFQTQRKAEEICNGIKKPVTPSIAAASCIYIAVGGKLKQKEIAEKLGISEVRLRETVKQIAKSN